MPDLPLVAQSLDYTCGAACFDSMFRYFQGWSPGEMAFAAELGTLELGYTPPAKIVELAQKYGFIGELREGVTLTDLRESFSSGGVVFVTWWDEDAGHYSLILGFKDDQIILMDPWTARESRANYLPLEIFIPNWNLRGARMITIKNGTSAASPAHRNER